jgi:hypothetical protein
MGRWGGDGRRTVEQTNTIEIGTLRRAGYVGKPESNWWKGRNKASAVGIRPSRWKDGFIRLPNQILQMVGITWRFGGQRFYFLCECGRRVEKLHAFRDRPWRCRHCYQLTYATRQALPNHACTPLHQASRVRRAQLSICEAMRSYVRSIRRSSAGGCESLRAIAAGHTCGAWRQVVGGAGCSVA